MRLFLGWRLTREINWIHPDIPERVESQDIMKLPSGQLPAMYSKSHLMFYQNKEFTPIPNDLGLPSEHGLMKLLFLP